MRFIVYSDIHSNLEALQEFFKIIGNQLSNKEKNRIKMLCLGDIIGYGASPSESLSLVLENSDIILKGNHERMMLDVSLRSFANNSARRAIEWTEKQLSSKEKEKIESFPEKAEIENRILVVHGSPKDPDEYIIRSNQALESIIYLKRKGFRLCFHGHTHLPGIFDENGRYFYNSDTIFNLSTDQCYLINPGSIGQPRDGDSRGSFCIFDEETSSLIFHRFNYDIKKSAEKIKKSGLPPELGDRLYVGR